MSREIRRRQPGFSGANALPTQPIVLVSSGGGKTFGDPINLAESAFNDAGARQKAFTSATTVPNAPTTTAPRRAAGWRRPTSSPTSAASGRP